MYFTAPVAGFQCSEVDKWSALVGWPTVCQFCCLWDKGSKSESREREREIRVVRRWRVSRAWTMKREMHSRWVVTWPPSNNLLFCTSPLQGGRSREQSWQKRRKSRTSQTWIYSQIDVQILHGDCSLLSKSNNWRVAEWNVWFVLGQGCSKTWWRR